MKALFGVLLTAYLLAAAPSIWGDEPFICELGDYTIYRQLLAQETPQTKEAKDKPTTIKTPIEGESSSQDLEAIPPNTLAGQTWGGSGPGRDGSCFGRSKRADWKESVKPFTDRYKHYG